MKLAIISRPFVFHGGVETATAGLVGALVGRGHEVHLYSPFGQLPVPGAVVHRIPLPPLPSLARALWLPIAAARTVRASGYEVVQSHELTLSQDIYRAGEGCHRAYLATRRGRTRPLYHRVLQALEARIFRTTPRIVAIARRGLDEIERLYSVPPARLRVVYNGVDLERFRPDNRARYRARVLESVGAPADAWVVLFAGSGFERKGLAFLIEGFSRFRDRSSRLVVLGKGDARPYRALAERLGIAARVIWQGPRADIERWYAASDVVALPSLYEPFGNVHLEALASGVPVVASAVAGGAEAIADGRGGAIVDPRDARAVVAALGRLRERNPGEVTDAARRAAEPFTFAAQVAGFGRIYAQMAAPRCDFS